MLPRPTTYSCLSPRSLYTVKTFSFQTQIRALGECTPPPRHVIISKWGKIWILLYPDSDPDHSQNLMGSKLEQDPSGFFSLEEGPTSSICVILQTNKQTNCHENNTSLAEIMHQITSSPGSYVDLQPCHTCAMVP